MMSGAPVTLLIILVTGWVTWQGLRRPEVMERLIFRPELIVPGRQWERMLSAALLHANWWHFGFNALALLMFGGLLERAFGSALLLIVYGGAVLGGSTLSLLLHRHEAYAALGASGGVSGVVFAATYFFPGMPVSLMFIPIFAPAWISALVFIAVAYFGARHRWGNIGHDAHLGGALAGLGIVIALHPAQLTASDWRLGAVAGAGLLSLVLLVAFPHGVGGRLLTQPARTHRGNLRDQDYDLARERNARRARLDALLDRIGQRGINSLSPAERRELDELSRMFRR